MLYLRQIFVQKRNLLSNAILDQFDVDGENFTKSFVELWDTLISILDDGNAGEIISLLDALDECEDRGRSLLTQKLCQLYGTERKFNLKSLITSRPYGDIRRGFQPLDMPGLPMIHLSGESESEIKKISREIDVFIRARVREIGARLKLTTTEKDLLLKELLRIPNRTYLWVHLTLDLVESDINLDKAGIIKAISLLPKTVNEAYNKTLSRSRDSEVAKRILQAVVAATRPLTVREMSLALVLREGHRSYDELNLTPEDRFREDLRDVCGLSVTIIDSRTYLLHQTAKEFLVPNASANTSGATLSNLEWRHSIQRRESHHVLTRTCIHYLLLSEFEKRPLDENGSLSQYCEDHVFLDYSAKYWVTHLRELGTETQDTIMQSILELCDVQSKRCLTWFRIYWASTNTDFPLGLTSLMLASSLGLGTVVKSLLKSKDVDLHAKDKRYRPSALSWAAGSGSEVVVKRLIESSTGMRRKYLKLPFVDAYGIKAADTYGRTPLTYAVWSGNGGVVRQLIKAGARADSKDEIGGTPLSYAVCYGREDMINMLLKRNAYVGSVNEIMRDLLLSAADKGHDAVVELLPETGKVNVDTMNSRRQTPLFRAAKMGHKGVVELLLGTGKANVNATDLFQWTPSMCAAARGHHNIAKLLLETGKVDVNAKNQNLQTALLHAAFHGNTHVVRLLLETDEVDVNAKDVNLRTALSYAAGFRHMPIVNMLLETGKVDVNADWESTSLPTIAEGGHEDVYVLLQSYGASL